MEQSVGRKSDVHIHWENLSPINDGLRDVFEPLAVEFSQEMQTELALAGPDRRQEIIEATGTAHVLPYGRVGTLPPAMFGDISRDRILLRKPLIVPSDEKEAQTFVDDYMRWAEGVNRWGRYAYTTTPRREILERATAELKGLPYPHRDWLVAAEAVQRHLREDKIFVMDAHRSNRIANSAQDYDQLIGQAAATHRPYGSYVLVISGTEAPDKVTSGTRDYVQLPVGEYGTDAASKLARITVAMSDFLKTSPAIDAWVRDHLDPETEALLVEHTARSRERHEWSAADYAVHGVKATLAEGLLSMAQTLSFLTAEKVEGYEDHDELVRAILDSTLIEQFTRLIKPGYIGPISLSGLYMPGALVVKNEKLAIGKDVAGVLSEWRRQHIAEMVAQWATYNTTHDKADKPQVLGLICPAASPNGAITTARDVFRTFYSADMQNAA